MTSPMRFPMLRMLRTARPLALSLLVATSVMAQAPAARPLPVIPMPASVRPLEGSWPVPAAVPVEVAYQSDAELATQGIRVRIVPGDSTRGVESYTLVVAADGVMITAPRMAGRFYGLLTLQQLVSAARAASAASPRVPAVRIEDAPRFAYRGLHLDVGRHFQPVAFVKRYIDLMARYKFNTFHWHLTEDQGWRIEIKKYPRLTEVASCRFETMVGKNFSPYVGDGTPHCGFYTQDEIRDVVAYAASRNVTVIPEIEMPGHTVAALTAYPELACTPGPFQVMTVWGVSDDILCPSEQTFTFVTDVLTEVLALFPSRMIHIGGDEAPKVRWKASPLAQEVMRREGLRDEHELQSYFIRRIDTWLSVRGRRLVGWDEILEGGLAPGATVMSWRGIAGGIDAARQGRDVIMTPNSHLYFDHYQGDPRFEPLAIGGLTTLEKVYAYEPIPTELSGTEARRILGAQANLWTEYLKTPAALEYMAYPRALALAEVVWSPREARDWASFAARLPGTLADLDRLRVGYRLPHVTGLDADVLTLEPKVRVTLGAAWDGLTVRYTLDGTDPTPQSRAYTRPFDVTTTFDGVTVTARAFMRDGRASPPRAATFRRTNYREAENIPSTTLQLGLAVTYHEALLRSTRGIDTLPVVRRGTSLEVSLQGDERLERFALRFTGFLEVPTDDLYEFELTADDGATLHVGDRLIVDNDGLHGTQARTGMVALRAGAHPLTVRYFQESGGTALTLRVRTGGGAWRDVPRTWYSHTP